MKSTPPPHKGSASPLKRLFRPSTLALLRESRQARDYSLLDLLHGYIYGRWIYLYISLGTGRHPLARRFLRLVSLLPKKKPAPAESAASPAASPSRGMAETYHGKVMPLEAARQLILVGEDVRLENLEKVIPYARARDLILKNPDHIVALDCPCRASLPNPCLPLDVCLVIGEPFASVVSEQHPRRSRWISVDEAASILQAEHERGHVHHAFFKDAMLGRFYAICNCCKCCCGAMQSHKSGNPMLASSGYLAQVEPDFCTGCESCREVCQFEALALDGYVMSVNEQACMGCGVCVERCSQGALSLVREISKGEPLEILKLMESL
jgi:NAD-dependent dihydropyrimidine dehydrogenase PreA subunit